MKIMWNAYECKMYSHRDKSDFKLLIRKLNSIKTLLLRIWNQRILSTLTVCIVMTNCNFKNIVNKLLFKGSVCVILLTLRIDISLEKSHRKTFLCDPNLGVPKHTTLEVVCL